MQGPLVPHKCRLIGNGNFYIAINDYTLTAQARCYPWVYCPVYKIFFLVRYFLDVIHSPVYINMAGTASANAAAIVL